MNVLSSRRKWSLVGISSLVVVAIALGAIGFLTWQRSAQSDMVVISVSPEAPLALQQQLAVLAARLGPNKVTINMRRGGEAVPALNQASAVDLYITDVPDAIHEAKEVQPLAQEELVLVVNPLNPVRSLRLDQLKQMVKGEIQNWQAVGGPNHPITWLALPKDDASSVWANIELGRWPQDAKVCADIASLKSELAKRSGAIAYLPRSAMASPAAEALSLTDNDQPRPIQRTWFGVVPQAEQSWWQKLTGVSQLWHHQAVMALVDDLKAQPMSGADSRQVTLTAVGDIMLGRKVAASLESQGYDYPFVALADKLKRADLRFGNLEAPLGTGGQPIPGKGIWYQAKPDAIASVANANFDVINVANNHILDYDSDVFLQTLSLLDQAKIQHVGGGKTLAEARQPVILERNGLRIGILGYSDMSEIFWDYSYPRMFAATEQRPGIAPFREAMMIEDIGKLKPKVDVIIVSLHWGEEYQNVPTAMQQQLAHHLVDAGAQLILGHHPHAIQGLEFYEGAAIAYSLGNFVTDQSFDDIVRESMVATFTLGPAGVTKTEVVPAFLTDNQPRTLSGDSERLASEKIMSISDAIYTLHQP